MPNESRDERTEPKEKDATSSERILHEQELVNEREHSPGEFGGMATPPVETSEPPARPRAGENEPVDEEETKNKSTDIQSEGA